MGPHTIVELPTLVIEVTYEMVQIHASVSLMECGLLQSQFVTVSRACNNMHSNTRNFPTTNFCILHFAIARTS